MTQESKKAMAYGGVVFDAEGRVFLRAPTNHFDGYVWTFAKGRADRGETDEAAALREVREELGVVAEIVAPIPGVFRGGTGSTRYWLMRAVSTGAPTDGETTTVHLATATEARTLIAQSTNATGRSRDLAVLEAALAAFRGCLSSGRRPPAAGEEQSMEQQVAPIIYIHPTRAAWGRAVAFASHSDRREFIFEDGKSRTFFTATSPLVMAVLPAAEAFALERSLRGKKAPSASKKQSGGPKKVLRLHTSTMTFARQIAIFEATFPKGFEDPKFLAQERGTGKMGKAAAMALARELLAQDVLEHAIASGEFSSVFETTKKLVRVTKNMLHPTFEGIDFSSAPPATHEPFARTLHDLLWGGGPYPERFAAFVAVQWTKRPYWTAATLFPALVHPQECFFVKPGVEQEQAVILGMEQPPGGGPTHTGYALYVAVGAEVRSRLVAAGHKPRDLMDVYSFVWKTLSKNSTAVIPTAASGVA